jgi:hypothetical protein
MLLPGNAGSNTTRRPDGHHDHVAVLTAVLTAAMAQVPTTRRKDLLIRAGGARGSHGLLEWPAGVG